jgi:hypothetical protein
MDNSLAPWRVPGLGCPERAKQLRWKYGGERSEVTRDEQRRSHRVPIEVPVEFTTRGALDKVPGVSKDISLGGMFIETASPAVFGASVLVGFTLPGHAPLLVSGTVRWTSGSGMGVQFGLLGARETYAITEIERQRVSLALPAERDVAPASVREPRMTSEDRRAAVTRAHRLQAQGRRISEIADALGVSDAVVHAWLAERP